MPTVFYSVMGEGRGHAIRARTLTEALRPTHRVVLYAGEDAYRFLAPLYQGSEVEVREIPSLRFAYGKCGKVTRWGTGRKLLAFLRGMGAEVRRLQAELEAERPDLVLTDFEPLLPRAAEKVGVPYISFDHQHFMIENDLSSLPLGLRIKLRFLRPGIQLMYRRQKATIVSSFYAPGIVPSSRQVYQVRSMIRSELAKREPSVGEHILVYVRRSTPERVLDELADMPGEFRVYGRGEQPARGSLSFRPISELGFLEDLVPAAGVICAAGNQLLGECLFLGKPVFALPETGQDEQRINAHFLEQSGRGTWCKPEDFRRAHAEAFLANLDSLRGGEERHEYNGTPDAVAAVKECLQRFAGVPTESSDPESRSWEHSPVSPSAEESPASSSSASG